MQTPKTKSMSSPFNSGKRTQTPKRKSMSSPFNSGERTQTPNRKSMSSPFNTGVSPESLSASGRSAEKLSLPSLQSKMKIDPEGYETELGLLYNQFKSSLNLFQQQAALSFTSISGVAADSSVAKDLGDRVMFLAHVTPFYLEQLSEFPKQLADLLRSSARSLPSSLRCHAAQALILLINRQIVDIGETLTLFMELQTFGDRNLRKLAFSHVVHSIKRMNQKHKNEAKNRALQNVLFSMLQREDEVIAKRSLITLCELHRRKLWFDDRTANAICTACFHSSSRIMIATLSFLLDYEKIEGNDNSDDSSSEDDKTPQNPQVALGKQAIYKASHQGTLASKKKKKAKLQRAMRSMKRQQRLSSENSSSNYYSPLNHLNDPQGFAEKLFSRLQTCNERFEIKMMMLKVIARTIGLHRLIVLNFYPYLQKYVQPHQRDVTTLLAAAVQACHDMVPPDAVEPLFKQIVNQFVHDHSRTEAIAVGLNVVREICLRMPLLMNEDLLQDLVLYKKSHEKAVSIAARSLIILFREICPSLLIKKDRGGPTDPEARPKAFGERNIFSDVPGVELLNDGDGNSDNEDQDDNDTHDESTFSSSGDEQDNDVEVAASDDELDQLHSDDDIGGQNVSYVDTGTEEDEIQESDDSDENEDSDDNNDEEEDNEENDEEGQEEIKHEKAKILPKALDNVSRDNEGGDQKSKSWKRKLIDFDVNTADTSLRALKRLATEAKTENASSDMTDGILSNEEFQRIKELKAKKEAKITLTRHGLIRKSVPSSDQLSVKRVDPAKLENNVKKKLNKEERLALVKAGREDRGKYQARAAVKQKKTGGLSNKQKEHKKIMPFAAKRAKVTRSRQDKKKQQRQSGKQFRGRKAWK